jgi:Dynein heavy chain AAA lid domain
MFKLRDVIKQRKIEEDQEYEYLLKECERDVIWSNALLCCIWSFGALLPKEHRRPFEEVFQPYKRMFNMSMSQSAAA